jgi:hypothetical protein
MSMSIKTIADLFQETPKQWGLRGDPYLWQEMQNYFAQTPLPHSGEQLEQLLTQAFETLTGQPITSEKFIAVDRFPRGGMSGGMVSPAFWRETAVPLLCERYTV